MTNQIRKTDTFFIISNYNTDPEMYLKYCEHYHIYDQSPDPEVSERLRQKYTKISFVQNTGHNISDYFRFFIDHYDALPSWMMLAKGNMIGRHIGQDFFERVYAQKQYTFLYSDRNWKDQPGVAYHLYDGAFLEINNSWYGTLKTNKYFSNFDRLLQFLFKDPILSHWTLFSPGACYIVSDRQVRRYPKQFYENAMKLLNYTYFPAEAYLFERMMNILFSGVYDLRDYCLSAADFDRELEKERIEHEKTTQQRPKGRASRWVARLDFLRSNKKKG